MFLSRTCVGVAMRFEWRVACVACDNYVCGGGGGYVCVFVRACMRVYGGGGGVSVCARAREQMR